VLEGNVKKIIFNYRFNFFVDEKEWVCVMAFFDSEGERLGLVKFQFKDNKEKAKERFAAIKDFLLKKEKYSFHLETRDVVSVSEVHMLTSCLESEKIENGEFVIAVYNEKFEKPMDVMKELKDEIERGF
jgi:uncharacterized protein YecE (DUF72 family)